MTHFLIKMAKQELLNLLESAKNITSKKIDFSQLSSRELIVIALTIIFILSHLNSFLVLLLEFTNICFGICYPAFKLFYALNCKTVDKDNIDKLTKYWIVYSIYNISSTLISKILGNNIFFVSFNIIFLYLLVSPNFNISMMLYNKLVKIVHKNKNKKKYEQFVNKISYIEKTIFFIESPKIEVVEN